MDRSKSWPWKKKSSNKSDKAATSAAVDSEVDTLALGASQVEKDNYKKPNYVQISVEAYTHLTGMQDQVHTLENQINEMNEKLSAAHAEITSKDNLVKQHAKVAEEAVSGWEKAEAEALALKHHLESVTLSKLSSEDQAAHLDGALKECMRQIWNLKEEHEQKLQDVVISKNKQFDKMKHDLEGKIVNLDQELLQSSAENAALSRSLKERSNMLIKLTEQKSQAENEIEILRANIESFEKEINSLKYELHMAAKELEIRNEEKNMSMRSAEVANKQQMEGVKKIAKLEAECQRLRGLVRKKLPGPAALAQMKLEVENSGIDYGDSRVRRSTGKPPSSHVNEFSIDGVQKLHKEMELHKERLLAMEKETNMLKEALAKRNSELQASRNLCAQTSSRLQALESQLHISNQQGSSPASTMHMAAECFPCQNGTNLCSSTTMSQDGSDDSRSANPLAMTLFAGLSQSKKETDGEKSNKVENVKLLELMDDFLEMEKLACLNVKGTIATLKSPEMKLSKVLNGDASGESSSGKDSLSEVLCDSESSYVLNHELLVAISKIHEFVLVLGEKAMEVHCTSSGDAGLDQQIEDFSATFSKVLSCNVSLVDFVFGLSLVLAKACKLKFNVLGYKGTEVDMNGPDCIDKVALPENEVVQKDSQGERYENVCAHISTHMSKPDVPDDGHLVAEYGLGSASCKVSLEEFEELKSEKENMAPDLAKSQLHETEQLLAEVRSQLASAQKSNSLSETQLKCMAESYRLLEAHAKELETEVILLGAKIKTLENELQNEKLNHQDALIRCKELEDQLQMNRSSSTADIGLKTKQERELTAAAQKLAECQETIFLLGKQLKALHLPSEFMGFPCTETSQEGGESIEDNLIIGGMNL